MRKALVFLLIAFTVISSAVAADDGAIPVKVLILPKFENGEMAGDFPGEAQYYYEEYLIGSDEYDIKGGTPGSKLYVKDGVALYVTGMIDYDLGHHADPREMENPDAPTWFHDASYDSSSYKLLDQDLMDSIYSLVKDVELETTEKTRAFMAYTFDNADWAVRDPMVLRGTTVTADNYWKGEYDQQNARAMCEVYGAPDPFALSEMEDVALAVVLDRFGLLDRYIIIRDSVNMVVFMNGVTPEGLWDPSRSSDSLSDEDSIEAADIFATAMENNFKVGSVVVDAILDGTL